MAGIQSKLLPWLRLVRVGTLFSPGCDVLAGAAIAAAAVAKQPELTLPGIPVLARAALASIAVYAAGMVFNDVADRQEDRLQRPERPLPRGDISLVGALALGALLIGLALLCSPVPSHHALLAALALAYDFVLKRNRALAALTMGTLRGANLGTAGLLLIAPSSGAGNAALTSPALGAALLAACICYGIYISFVTILGILEDATQPRRGVVLLVQSVPPVAAVTGITIVSNGPGVASLLAAALLLAFFVRMLRVPSWDRRSIRGSMTWLLLGTMCYTALLAAGAGSLALGLGIAACIVPARRLSRWISLT